MICYITSFRVAAPIAALDYSREKIMYVLVKKISNSVK